MATKSVHSKEVVDKMPGDSISHESVSDKSGKALSPELGLGKLPSPVKSAKVTSSKKHVYNEETIRVLRDADAGKNLRKDVDTDDLFKKLGLKGGKVSLI